MHELLSVTFHHVSSPVAAMKSIVRLLREGRVQRAEEAEFVEKLWLLLEDCRMMIENHGRYARLIRGMPLQTELRRFDIVQEVEFRRQVIYYKYKGSQQELLWESAAKPTFVNLDQVMVGDIVQNLLDNACKYSPARTKILVKVASSKRQVFVEVSDGGPGLPDHVAASLFAEGVRGELAAESKSPGLGLGLFMVYRYTSLLGGDIWYEDSEMGGTKFTVCLPREGKA